MIGRLDVPQFTHQLEQGPQICVLATAAMFWRVGSGKTRSDLEDTAWQYNNGIADAHLIVCPSGVHLAWIASQVPVWVGGQPVTIGNVAYGSHQPLVNQHEAMYFLSKSESTTRYWRELNEFAERPGLKILAMHFEGLASKSGFEFARSFVERAGRVKITVDESHRIKSPGATTTKHLGKLRDLKSCVIRRIMTATPTANGPEDLYSQYRFLDPAILDCSTFAEFKGMFVHEVPIPNTHFKKVVDYRNIKYLNKRIAPYTFVAKKPEGLPPQHWNTVTTSVSDEQRHHYSELRNDYQTQLRTGHWVEADLAITRIKRLQQVAAGHLRIMDPDNERKTKEVVELECPRIQDTIDTVMGCPEKVIVWAQERYEIERLLREFTKAGIGSTAYYGPMKTEERAKSLYAFENDRDIKVMIANDATGGTGLTIVGKVAPVADMVFYSHTWSRILREQCEGRNHRPGTLAERCVYTDMIAMGTMDARIRARVKLKDDLAKLVENPRLVAALLDPDLDYQTGGDLIFAQAA